MDRSEFVTDRADIPKGTGKGEAGSRKKRNSNQIVIGCVGQRRKMVAQDLGKCLPDVRRCRRVREVIWECDLYGGTGPSVLEVLLGCGFRIS
ncbi:unnamed protein product, partial [Staurois parvus]